MKIKTAYMGLLLAFALILSYLEAVLSFQTGIPGIKLGLANLAVVLCLYLYGWKEAMLLTIVKAIISGLLFGNLSMILYSLSGAVLSCAVMAVLKKTGWFHLPVASVTGGVMHNVGQLIVAYFIVQTYGILYYVPALIIAGMITGLAIGIAAALVLPYISKLIEKEQIR